MQINIEKTPIICALEQRLNDDYKIILFRLKETEIFRELCMALRDKQEKIEIWTCADYVDEYPQYPFVSLLSQAKMDEIIKIYRVYEFTDKLMVLSEDAVCPGIMNYLKQGILDKQSMVAAVTYNIAYEKLQS